MREKIVGSVTYHWLTGEHLSNVLPWALLGSIEVNSLGSLNTSYVLTFTSQRDFNFSFENHFTVEENKAWVFEIKMLKTLLLTLKNLNSGLESWLSREEYLALLQRAQVGFSAPRAQPYQATHTPWNFSSRGCNTLYWPLKTPHIHEKGAGREIHIYMYIYVHAYI